MPEIEQSAPPPSERAVRLIFEYEDDTVRLVSAQHVEMIVPSSDPVEDYVGQGCWVALHDAQNRTLFRRVVPQALRNDVEGPSDLPGHRMMRRPLERPAGTFVVVVPELAEAENVTVWNNPQPADRARFARAEGELARFPMPKRGPDEAGR
jgi:hypothetical protein